MSAKKKVPTNGKNGGKSTGKRSMKKETATRKAATRSAGGGGPKSKPINALDAAAKVLGETGQPMSCKELIDSMANKGYWTSPGGKTPANTLYSAILREMSTKNSQARFVKAERGKFSLKTKVRSAAKS